MGGLKDFLIYCHQPNMSDWSYCPGDVLTGELLLHLTRQKAFKKIVVEVVRKVEAEYVEQEVTVHQVRK